MNFQNNLKDRYFIGIIFIFFLGFAIPFFLLFIQADHPFLIRGQDPHGHYIYIRSLFFDHDLDFKNEALAFDYSILFPFENMANSYYPIGPAIAWFPFWIIGHLTAKLLNFFGASYPLVGYSIPYYMAITLGEKLIGLVGVFYAYRLAKIFVNPDKAFFAVAIVWFSSPFLFYMYVLCGMSHVVSMASVSIFLYYFFSTLGNRTGSQWAFLGFLGGAVFLAKWQNALYVFLPMAQSIYCYICYLREGDKVEVKKIFYRNIVFSVVFLLTISPQVLVWKIVYGSFSVPGQGQLNLSSPHILEMLFSTYHGLFTWNPIFLFSVAGVILYFKKNRQVVLFLLLGLFLQIYYGSSVYDWWSSDSFGQRRMVNATPIFICGLAFLMDYFKKKYVLGMLKITGVAFAGWNLLFIYQYVTTIMANDRALTVQELIFYKFRLIGGLIL